MKKETSKCKILTYDLQATCVVAEVLLATVSFQNATSLDVFRSIECFIYGHHQTYFVVKGDKLLWNIDNAFAIEHIQYNINSSKQESRNLT